MGRCLVLCREIRHSPSTGLTVLFEEKHQAQKRVTYRQLLISTSLSRSNLRYPLKHSRLQQKRPFLKTRGDCNTVRVCAPCASTQGAAAVSTGRSRRELKRHLGICGTRAKGCSALIKFNLPIMLRSTTPRCTAPIKLENELTFGSGKQIKKASSHPSS